MSSGAGGRGGPGSRRAPGESRSLRPVANSRGLQLPACIAHRAPPRASVLAAAPRGPVGAVVRARDSQRRVRPGRAVAAGPRPGVRYGGGVGRAPNAGRVGAGLAVRFLRHSTRKAGGRSCGSAGAGEQAWGCAARAAGTEEAPPGCGGESGRAGPGWAGGAAWTPAGARVRRAAPPERWSEPEQGWGRRLRGERARTWVIWVTGRLAPGCCGRWRRPLLPLSALIFQASSDPVRVYPPRPSPQRVSGHFPGAASTGHPTLPLGLTSGTGELQEVAPETVCQAAGHPFSS